MTRIIAGRLGGRRLETPRGAGTRPTSDRVREALFAALEHQDRLAGAAVLDLYAGSGALGLEAISRGARIAVFVESDRTALAVLRRNAAVAATAPPSGGDPAVDVRGEPVERVLVRGTEQAYDLVLADPPYGLGEDALADVLALLPRHGWLAGEALVVVERSSRSPEPRWPTGLALADERRYGETRLWWAERRGGADAA